jgi:5-methylcytosine-specific restriction endonuclease McrA
MKGIRTDAGRVRLDPVSYGNLRQEVLRRDTWRCQSCGAMSNLEVHHQLFRSHSGDDSEQNLITLCRHCHRSAHANRVINDKRNAETKT